MLVALTAAAIPGARVGGELDVRLEAPDTEEAPRATSVAVEADAIDAWFESTFEVAVVEIAAVVDDPAIEGGAARAAIAAKLELAEFSAAGGAGFDVPAIEVAEATSAGSRVAVSTLVVVGIVA